MDTMIARSLTPLVLLLLALGVAAAACGDDDGGGAVDGARVTVTTAADTNERDGEVSLREAILVVTGQLVSANMDEGERDNLRGVPGLNSDDLIEFDLGDETTITLEEPLPPLIGGGDTLDATGADVTIDGGAADYLCLDLSSSGIVIYGLTLTGCRTAIDVGQAVTETQIGGPGEGEGNVIINNTVGIKLAGRNNVVQGNHIGVEPGATEASPNEFEGIWLTPQARDNRIGGPGEGEGNVISGNSLFGIAIDGAEGTVVQGNYIGLDTTGRIGVRNMIGIKLHSGAFANLIGGADSGDRNVISGNGSGIQLTGEDTTSNTIQGNLFSTSVGEGEGIPNDEDIYYDAGVGENEVIDNDLGA